METATESFKKKYYESLILGFDNKNLKSIFKRYSETNRCLTDNKYKVSKAEDMTISFDSFIKILKDLERIRISNKY